MPKDENDFFKAISSKLELLMVAIAGGLWNLKNPLPWIFTFG